MIEQHPDPAIESRWMIEPGEALRVLSTLPDAILDAVITDPPYSSGGIFRGDRAGPSAISKYVHSDLHAYRIDFAGDTRDQRGHAYWCALWLAEALRASVPGATAAVFTDWRQLPTTTDALQAAGWVWRGVLAWDKTEAVRPRLGGFASQCEYVVWGTKGPVDSARNPVALPGVVRVPPPKGDGKHHIAEKPVGLMRVLARIAPTGGLICDPFMGSGSTGVGALEEGRRFLGIDFDPHYVSVATRRLEDACTRVELFTPEPPPTQDRLDLEPVEDPPADGIDLAGLNLDTVELGPVPVDAEQYAAIVELAEKLPEAETCDAACPLCGEPCETRHEPWDLARGHRHDYRYNDEIDTHHEWDTVETISAPILGSP